MSVKTNKCGKFLLALVAISLILGSISVKAQVDDKLNENITQYELKIYLFEPSRTFSSDGIDKARMCITLINKTSGGLEHADSDIEVLLKLGSQIGDLSTHEVKILKDSGKSEDFNLTSTQPGTVVVVANAVNFDETNASITFEPPPVPSEIYMEAHPDKNILANNNASTTLTVELLKADGEPFKPSSDINIDLWTTTGETVGPVTIFKDKFYGKTKFATFKPGDVNITASSPEYTLNSMPITVSFVTPFTFFAIIIATIGGLVGGFIRYYSENQKGIVLRPTRQKDGTWRLGMIGDVLFHALSGCVVYLGAIYNWYGTNLVPNFPTYTSLGSFLIGLFGGLSFTVVLFVGGKIKNRLDK